MKSIINSLILALAMYSGIPVPQVERKQKNMRYTLCFVPIIGLVIGVLVYGWSMVCAVYGFGQVCFALVGTVIPVIVTGGVHLRGLLYTADAIHSHKIKEKRRQRPREAGAGVSAVIAGFCFFMLYGAGLTLIWKKSQLLLLALGYIISRALSGMSIVWFPAAEEDGNADNLFLATDRRIVRVVLVTLLALAMISAVIIHPVIGTLMALAAMWVWTYYYYMTKKRFGGISENTAGYFLCLCELSSVLVVGMLGRVM